MEFRRPDEPGSSLRSAESARWVWKETPTRGRLQKGEEHDLEDTCLTHNNTRSKTSTT